MPTADNDTLLIFRIATIACAVPAQGVDTIVMPPEHLTHPPGTGKSTPGIFRHSGQVHAVIDLHERFGIDTPRQGAGRLLLNHDSGRHYAFWVDEVVGLVRSEQGTWAALPPYLPRDLFWSGFLYRKEIVLCTRLADLLRMRDASPLHLHLAALQPKAEPAETSAESTTNISPPAAATAAGEKRVDVPPAANAADTPPPGRAAETPVHRSATAAPAKPPASPAVHTVRRTPQQPPRPATANKKERIPPRQERRPPTMAACKPADQRPPVPSTGKDPVAPARPKTALPVRPEPSPAEAPTSAPGTLGRWLALLTFLGLGAGGGYWLWSGSVTDTGGTLRPITIENLPSAAALDDNRQPITEKPSSLVPSLTAAPTPQPEVVASPERPAGAAYGQQAGQALRIERDSEGTLNLIIDRAALQAQATPSASTITAERLPALSSGVAEAESPLQPVTAIPEEKETPLQPEADWPAPIPVTVEPCDCTHIVSKGDTLWDIAEHYTKNAYNYHELARRSGIHNPDRIYPGDKVRIIIR